MEFIVILLVVGGTTWLLRKMIKGAAPANQTIAPDLSMLPSQFVIYDLETTGLNCESHEIIEIGAIKATRDSNMHATFQTLVMPIGRISAKTTEITGLDRSKLKKDGIPIKEALQDFIEFIGDLPLVAYNADFDRGFLKNACEQSDLPTLRNSSYCAMKMARKAWPGRGSYKLSSLADDGNLSRDNEHRALGDCQRTLIVFVAAARKLGKIF
jgi:DNA polymerase III subunit epsilon